MRRAVSIRAAIFPADDGAAWRFRGRFVARISPPRLIREHLQRERKDKYQPDCSSIVNRLAWSRGNYGILTTVCSRERQFGVVSVICILFKAHVRFSRERCVARGVSRDDTVSRRTIAPIVCSRIGTYRWAFTARARMICSGHDEGAR